MSSETASHVTHTFIISMVGNAEWGDGCFYYPSQSILLRRSVSERISFLYPYEKQQKKKGKFPFQGVAPFLHSILPFPILLSSLPQQTRQAQSHSASWPCLFLSPPSSSHQTQTSTLALLPALHHSIMGVRSKVTSLKVPHSKPVGCLLSAHVKSYGV